MMFRKSNETEFAAVIEAKASKAFTEVYARFQPTIYAGWDGEPDFSLHDGPLQIAANWTAPALCTLVAGDLEVDGLLDLANPYDKGFDEGGLFVVLGAVRCRSFAGEGGKCVFVDGSVAVRDFMVTCQEDSGVVILGDLDVRFLFTADTRPAVGGTARVEYGDGPCLDIDYAGLKGTPRHDPEASAAAIGVADLASLEEFQLVDEIRAGKLFFK